MNATDELQRMLTERGAEYIRMDTHRGELFMVSNGDDAYYYILVRDRDSGIEIWGQYITPEQAIAATLGPAVRHPKPHEQWTTVLLPEIAWDWDDRWPDYLSVAHDANGEWRVYVPEATLGAGKCHADETDTIKREVLTTEQKLEITLLANELLVDNNAKLRELCAEMFDDCVDECDKWRYAGRMRELGIEVDE